MSRPWTPADDARLRELWGNTPSREIAFHLRRSRSALYQRCLALGLRLRGRMEWTPDLDGLLRKANAAGWSDAAMARWLGCSQPLVSKARRAMGLPARRDVWGKQAVRSQLRTLGLAAPSRLRSAVWVARAVALGWPDRINDRAINLRHVQILELLWAGGPQTRRQIAERISLAGPNQRAWLKTKAPGGSYLAELMRAGLVERSSGRLIAGRGKGSGQYLYALAPGVAPNREQAS